MVLSYITGPGLENKEKPEEPALVADRAIIGGVYIASRHETDKL